MERRANLPIIMRQQPMKIPAVPSFVNKRLALLKVKSDKRECSSE